MVELHDQSKRAAMQSVLADLETLTLEERILFISEADATKSERAAAESALSRWQAATGWTPQVLTCEYPLSATVLDFVLESRVPRDYPYVARTAVLDALRCILVAGLSPETPVGVLRVLAGPVSCVLQMP